MEDRIIDSNPLRIVEGEIEIDNNNNTSTDSMEKIENDELICLMIVEEENISRNEMNDSDNNLHSLSLQIDNSEGVESNSNITNEAVKSTTIKIGSNIDDDDEFSGKTPQLEAHSNDDSIVNLLGEINDIVGQKLIR